MVFKIPHLCESYVFQWILISGTEEKGFYLVCSLAYLHPLSQSSLEPPHGICHNDTYIIICVSLMDYLFSPEKAAFGEGDAVFFIIVFRVPRVMPGTERAVWKWLWIESMEKVTPFYQNGQGGVRGQPLQAGSVPGGNLVVWGMNSNRFPGFYRKKK